jgi:hypothetical protein
MNSLTESNFRSVEETLLGCIKDTSSFLDTLQTCYRIRSVGNNLPFTEIEAYWHNGSSLSDAWLDELGRSIRCERPQGLMGWSQTSKLEWIKNTLLEGLEPSEWFVVAEKSLYLLSPLVEPERLVKWITYSKECSSKKIKTGVWCSSFVESLKPLAESLAKGEEGWQDVSAWLENAGSDSGFLLNLLEKVPADKWHDQDDYCSRLSAHLTLLILIRLLLRVENSDRTNWVNWTFLLSGLLTGCNSYPVDRADHQGLQRNHAAPILRAACSSADIVHRLSHQLEARTFQHLMNDLGMAIHLAQQPERYQELVEALDNIRLQAFWPSDELAETAPDLLFYHVRRLYERTGQLSFPKFTTLEAVIWYRERLSEIQDDRQINDGINWLAQRLPQADCVAMLDQFCNKNIRLPYNVLDTIDDIDALLRFLGCFNKTLSKRAASQLTKLALLKRREREENKCEYEPDPKLWPLLIEQCERYPDLFIEATLCSYRLHPQELDRWELLWQCSTKVSSRQSIAEALLNASKKDGRSDGVDSLALAERLYGEDPKPFQAFVDEQYEDYLDSYIAAISVRDNKLWELIPKMAARYLMQSTWFSGPVDTLNPAPIQKALARYPKGYATLEDKAQVKLLPFFNDQAVITCGAALAELFGKINKNFYQPAVKLIVRSSLNALRESGLLNLSGKKARKLMLTGLALHTAPDAGQILRQLIDDRAHDDFSRGLMLDNLEARGEPVEGLDDWSDLTLERVQELAAKQKIPVAVTKLWNADLAESLSDLGEQGGLYLLRLSTTGDGERLPRKARQVLGLIPAGRRADFALLGVNQWIAENGSDKLKALLPALFEYGDERVANALVKACKAWKKTRKPKSSAAIRLLCRMPGSYGIAQAHALWESGQFSESIMNNARMALSEAAERERMSFQEFIEQLVPDFGLDREGLALDVGPYSYQVKIKPDLSLMVVGPNGRATKSLPRAKPDEDPDKRSLAENQFKGLRKNLKPVLKQQSRRLMRGFTAGKRWDLALWQRLFIDHPLMNIIAQGIVWGAEDGEGDSLVRFRPSDTGEMLDLDDESITLEGAVFVHIVHPTEVDVEECAAWRAHFDDYGVTSPFGQWDVPVFEADAQELEAERVTRQRDALINRGTFGGLMEKWGYLKGPAEDGAMINGHTWLVSHGEWLIECEHSGVSVFFDADEEVSVTALVPHRYAPEESYHHWKPVALKALPIALQATLLAQAEALKAAALD